MHADQLRQFERINVVGTSGSGKTTFARQLVAILSLPCIEMDQLYWKANWQPSSDEELLAKVESVVAGDRWVTDGNYTRTTPQKWSRVQLVIWLDLSFPRTVWRVTRRAISRSITRQELWPGTGNRESIRLSFFSRDSVIWWSIKTHRSNRLKYEEAMTSPEFAHIRFLRLSNPEAVSCLLDSLRCPSATKTSVPAEESD